MHKINTSLTAIFPWVKNGIKGPTHVVPKSMLTRIKEQQEEIAWENHCSHDCGLEPVFSVIIYICYLGQCNATLLSVMPPCSV